jgi:hypothetical protein
VNPGASPGTIAIGTSSQDYTQQSAGVLNIEIGGTAAGVQYDQVTVADLATLAGTLNLSLINGYEPNLGDTFTIMTFNSRSGTFSTVNGLTIGNGKQFQIGYNAKNIVLTVVAQ